MKEQMKVWLGVDPGRTGALALIDEGGNVGVYDWMDEEKMFAIIGMWGIIYHIVAVAMEDTPAMKRDSKQSATTFQQHCGAWKCLIKLSGFDPVMVRPVTWMKRRIRQKQTPSDKPSLDYVETNYPGVDLKGPRGGKMDGRSDAICIAEWCKENHSTTQ
ncbi:MAG: hypothetical protein GY753_11920 [Gammaproteobacteria bacterium]|nr:hypothetical protein [Gammaproteobacteria bacterium]